MSLQPRMGGGVAVPGGYLMKRWLILLTVFLSGCITTEVTPVVIVVTATESPTDMPTSTEEPTSTNEVIEVTQIGGGDPTNTKTPAPTRTQPPCRPLGACTLTPAVTPTLEATATPTATQTPVVITQVVTQEVTKVVTQVVEPTEEQIATPTQIHKCGKLIDEGYDEGYIELTRTSQLRVFSRDVKDAANDTGITIGNLEVYATHFCRDKPPVTFWLMYWMPSGDLGYVVSVENGVTWSQVSEVTVEHQDHDSITYIVISILFNGLDVDTHPHYEQEYSYAY